MAKPRGADISQPARLLFDANYAVAFLARVDCHLAALETYEARLHFIDVKLAEWLRHVPENDEASTRQVVQGLVRRRKQALEEKELA